jgi:glutamate dehydrogenase/leucine dehydrogenase
MEQMRVRKVAQQKKSLQEKKLEKQYKSYSKAEQLPKDWSFKLGLDISIPCFVQKMSSEKSASTSDFHIKMLKSIERVIENVGNFYVFNVQN